MKPELTIIIPCYNCEKTLEEAVNSCFVQGLSGPFEVIMVDDCSTDGTREVMKRLAKQHKEIKLFYHDKNKGGGAARNTAIEHAQADVIFCLDSDDMLAEGTLSKMLGFMKDKIKDGQPCDGVGVHHSKKFHGTNVKDIEYEDIFSYAGEVIPFESLFQHDRVLCPLYSTFMHTKEAFKVMGGYPTDHGFDTQGFAWRFLANGLTAYTCPSATYLHRVAFGRSYYIREYESGKANYNWFLVLLEFLYLFNESAKELIFGFDINSDKNIFEELCKESDVLAPGYRDSILPRSQEAEKRRIEGVPEKELKEYDAYWIAQRYATEKKYIAALNYFKLAYEKGLRHPDSFSRAILSVIDLPVASDPPEKIVMQIITPCNLRKRGSSAPLFGRIYRKSARIIKGHSEVYKVCLHIYLLFLNIKKRISEGKERRDYFNLIETIKKDKRMIVDLRFGGLGDCLAWTSLPRLLYERYGVEFFLSKQAENLFRNKDIFKLCFEMNPYFKGFSSDGPLFQLQLFESEKSLYNFLMNNGGPSAIETMERQFGLSGNGTPEIFYKPKLLKGLADTVLIDKNYISGKKLGWLYSDASFEHEAKKHLARSAPTNKKNTNVQYVNPKNQDLFAYADMIYSCKHFITVLSGGAALAAAFNKQFTVILPYNTFGGSVDQFVFKKSTGYYTK